MWPLTGSLSIGLILGIFQLVDSTSSSSSAPLAQHNVSGGVDQAPVDEILKETFVLLEELDERLAQVKKKSPLAMAKDNARALESLNINSSSTDDASIEEALTRLADNFSSGRQSSSGNEDPLEVASSSKKTARQLSFNDSHQQPIASDSTERHIKFTLDLMHSIFSSQGYTSKTNQIESFLISPLSIQMVLMMMHLGARGQTRHEINDCLHLLASTQTGAPSSPSGPLIEWLDSSPPDSSFHQSAAQANKLKRRHHQQSTSHSSSSKQLHSSSSTQHSPASASATASPHSASVTHDPHKLFSGAMRNLLKDPIIMKALTNANQIFLQKNLPLSAQYERSIRHYYGVDVKLVDFQHQSYGNEDASGFKQLDSPSTDTQNGSQNSSETGKTSPPNNVQLMVNEWIERQTKGRISNFLTSPVSTSTLMMAINVLYFRGDWQYKFDPSDTETDAWFTKLDGKTVKMPMMVNRLPLAFAHDSHLKASVIELPYKAQRLGLFLLLPDEVGGIFHTMQMLNSSSFAHMIASMRKPQSNAELGAANGINVRLPKFTIESSPHLSRILGQELGLKTLFSPDSADLSGMFAPPQSPQTLSKRSTTNSSAFNNSQPLPLPPQVGLDELLHKAVLEVDEQGSVAAASSASIIERVGLFNSNYFEADHPFLLFLMDKQTGLVLFSGVFAGNNNH